jgi:hypothetical protein
MKPLLLKKFYTFFIDLLFFIVNLNDTNLSFKLIIFHILHTMLFINYIILFIRLNIINSEHKLLQNAL